MRHLHIDIETYSEAELANVGAYKYAEHPSTRITLVAWAFDDGMVQQADLFFESLDLPKELVAALLDPTVQKWAHNANFERTVLASVLGLSLPPEQWRCTMAWALSLGLPGGLADLAPAVSASAQKLETDKRLINRLCTPRFGGPEKNRDLWPRFKEYNVGDVEAERAVARKLARFPMPEFEWQLWAVDQRINDRGLPIDLPFVAKARRLAEANGAAADEVVRRHGVDNPRSVQQLRNALGDLCVGMPDMRKNTVNSMLAEGDLPAAAEEILWARRELASASIRKYDKLAEATCRDGRMRGTLQFHGAKRTGRWGGRLFQPQNLPSGMLASDQEIEDARGLVMAGDIDSIRLLWGDVSPVMSSLVRSAIAAPPGYALVSCDFASIETVMIAWGADCQRLLDVFRRGRDAYKETATRIFGVRYEDVTKAQRKQSKPVVLGGGFGMGAGALQAYAQSFGVDMTPDEARHHVAVFRQTYPEIPRWWYATWAAVERAMGGEPTDQGPFHWRLEGKLLRCRLPSGRWISYFRPKLIDGRYGPELQYDGDEAGKRMRVSTHGAKLVENLTQAIARDVLGASLVQADKVGIPIVLHVHDEPVALVREERAAEAKARLIEIMGTPPAWCPDAPIKAAGWTGRYYKKD